MQPYLNREMIDDRVVYKFMDRRVSVEWVPLELINSCIDFCDADPSTYDAEKVANALAPKVPRKRLTQASNNK